MFVYIIVLNLTFVIQWFAKGIKINWNLFKQNFPPEVFIYLKETNLKVGFIACQGKIKLFVLIVMNLSAILVIVLCLLKKNLVGYFVARDSKCQPITWEIHGIFLLKKTPYNFNVNIDRTVRCDYLIKKFDFVSCKIIGIQVPKDKKLNEEQKSFLSKMFVRFY